MPLQATLANRGKGLCLLSLDAGGTRGISQLKILTEMMHQLNFDATDDQKLRPCDVFDMIGGTGSGGFITILLVAFGLTVEESMEEFIELSINILEKRGIDAEARMVALKVYIENLLEKYGLEKEIRLLDPNNRSKGCQLVVPISYKRHVGPTSILRNFGVRKEQALNMTISEALQTTLATPPLFTSTTTFKDSSTFEYIAADLTLSNPTREVIAEAHSIFGEGGRVACLLSIGSGHPGVFKAPDDSDLLSWNLLVERLATDSEQKAQSIDAQMGHLGIYHRFCVTRGLETSGMTDKADPGVLLTHTAVYLSDVAVTRNVAMCIDILRVRDGVASLEQLAHSGGQRAVPLPLPPLTRTFVMRTEPWKFMEKSILGMDDPGGPRMLAVTGMGGCGKTQMVLKFLRVHQQKFELCLFVDGSSAPHIRADVIRHIRSLSNAHTQMAFEECLLFLSQPALSGQRMIVYDNVDDPHLDLAPLLPTGESCVIIVTSRNRLLGDLCPGTHLELDVMSMDEAIELLLSSVGRPIVITEQARKDAGAIAQALGCLPIALQQARSYISQTKCSARAYLDRLTDSRDELLAEPAKFQLDMAAVSTYAAFETSFKKLSLHSQKFLRLLSYFHWSKFPIELIMLAAKYNFSEYRFTYTEQGEGFHKGKAMLEAIFLRDSRWSIIHLDKMMIELQNYSLIASTPGVDTTLAALHPLAHGWLQSCIPEHEFVPYRCAAVLLLALGRNEYPPSAQYLTNHIIHLSALWNYLHVNDAEAFAHILHSGGASQGSLKLRERVLRELRSQAGPESRDPNIIVASIYLALTCRDLGKMKEAVALQEEVLKLRKEILGERHPDTIAAFNDLAIIYGHLGKLKEEEMLQEEVLKLNKEMLGERHLNTIGAANNLALTYAGLGKLKDAEGLQEVVLKVRKEMLGERHRDTITASSNLALTYCGLGKLKEAEALQEEVLELMKEILGERHPDTIMASGNLALTYCGLGNLEEAEAMQGEVLELMKEILGERHPDTIAASSNLAITHSKLGNLKEAEALQENALKLMKEVLGERHPDTIMASSNLAVTYGGLGRLKEAEATQGEVLELRKEILGERHPDTIAASNNLAITHSKLGNLKEAEATQGEVLELRKEILGERHPDTITASSNLALTYCGLGNLKEAEAMQGEVLELNKEIFGERHPNTIEATNDLALTYAGLGKLKDAEGLQEAVLKVRKEILGERHPDTITASSNLALTYRELGKLKEAEALQEDALKLRKEVLGERHPETITASNNLALTHFYLGRLEEAEVLQEEVLKFRTEVLGERHPDTLMASNNFADCYLKLGRLEAAKSLQLETLRRVEDVLGGEHPTTTLSMITMAKIYEALNNKVDALKLLDVAEPIVARKLGKDHRQYTELRAVRARVEALVTSQIFMAAPSLGAESATLGAAPPSPNVAQPSRRGGMRKLIARVRDRLS